MDRNLNSPLNRTLPRSSSRLSRVRVMASEHFVNGLSRIAVAQICHTVFDGEIKQSALETLTDILPKYIEEIGRVSSFCSEAACRTEVNFFDINTALKELGNDFESVKSFFENSDEVPFAKDIPDFPVPSPARLCGPSNIVPEYVETSQPKDEVGGEADIQHALYWHDPAQASSAAAKNVQQKPSINTRTLKRVPRVRPGYVPSHLPPMPDPHTYKETAVYSKRETVPSSVRQIKIAEKAQIESSLVQLGQKDINRLRDCVSKDSSRESPSAGPSQSQTSGSSTLNLFHQPISGFSTSTNGPNELPPIAPNDLRLRVGTPVHTQPLAMQQSQAVHRPTAIHQPADTHTSSGRVSIPIPETVRIKSETPSQIPDYATVTGIRVVNSSTSEKRGKSGKKHRKSKKRKRVQISSEVDIFPGSSIPSQRQATVNVPTQVADTVVDIFGTDPETTVNIMDGHRTAIKAEPTTTTAQFLQNSNVQIAASQHPGVMFHDASQHVDIINGEPPHKRLSLTVVDSAAMPDLSHSQSVEVDIMGNSETAKEEPTVEIM
eukprot:173891_1